MTAGGAPEDLLQFYKSQLDRSTNSLGDIHEAIQKLPVISHALGCEEVCQKLLPFLNEWIADASDDLTFAFAAQVPKLANFIGNKRRNLHLLVNLCKKLAWEEETVVRNQSLSAIRQLMAIAGEEGVGGTLADQSLLPTAKEMIFNSTVGFAPKISGVQLLPIIVQYTKDGEIRKTAIALLEQAVHDELPIVRRAAAGQLAVLAKFFSLDETTGILLPLVKAIRSQETQEAMLVAAVKATTAAAAQLCRESNEEMLMPALRKCYQEDPWRLRTALVEDLAQVCRSFRKCGANVRRPLTLLRDAIADSESIVRTAALRALGEVVDLLEPGEIDGLDIDQKLAALLADNCVTVKVEAAAVLIPVARTASPPVAVSSFVPLVIEYLKSESHDVRIHIVKQLTGLMESLDTTKVGSVLIDALNEGLHDVQWYVRKEALKQLPKVAKLYGSEGFRGLLEGSFIASFADPVEAVRAEARDTIIPLAQILGANSLITALVPFLVARWEGTEQLEPLRTVPCRGSLINLRDGGDSAEGGNTSCTAGVSYMARIGVLKTLPVLAEVLPVPQIEASFNTIVARAMEDNVSNVRLALCRLAPDFCKKLPETTPLCKDLKGFVAKAATEDDNVDVRYFAEQARLELL